MVQVANNFAQLTDLDPVLTEVFYQSYMQHPPRATTLFAQRASNKAKETDLRVGSFSDPVAFDGTIVYDTADPDYAVEYSHVEYAKGFQVERRLMDDMQYDSIFQSASDLGQAFARFIEKEATNVFNNAFSASFTGYDAKPLCSTTHPRSKTDSTVVVNHLTSTALTHDNLEVARLALLNMVDDIGQQINLNPNLLIVPNGLAKTAKELVMSELRPDVANNAINTYMGEMQYIVLPFLTVSTTWFVADSAMMNRYLKWYTRVAPEFAATDNFDTLVRKYRGYGRWSKGWSDFRFIVGCQA